MKIEGPLLRGRFRSRPNRFLTLVEVDGQLVESHLPDPGRLKELLLPGTQVLLRLVSDNTKRKTAYSTVMVRHGNHWVSVDTLLPNRFVNQALQEHILPMFSPYTVVKPEVSFGRHRFDFLLRDAQGNPFYLEVKSVTYVEQGIARFPDAVSLRGRRHAEALQGLVEKGIGAGILFICQRPDARQLRPFWSRDPQFGEALKKAFQAGVRLWCITLKVTEKDVTYQREIPINLTPD
jgi:sugar fermentation stimulation protein A